jgi:Zn-dependent protease
MTLEFRLGPIPIRIHPWFLLSALILGLGAHRGPAQVALWAGGFLATVLVHELGHAVAARSYGVAAEVNLTLFRAGLALRVGSLSVARRVLVCLAGPAMSLGVAAMAFAIARAHPTGSGPTGGVLLYLGWINLGWGLLNLLPILPLDAGNALVALLDGATKGRGEPPVRWLSIIFAVSLGLVALHYRMALPVLLCAVVAVQNVRTPRAAGPSNREAIVRVHSQAAFDAIERGDAITAAGHCRTVLAASADPATRRDAVRLLAYAYASMDMWSKLMTLLESGGVTALEDGELEKYERVARELGRSEEAKRIAWLRSRLA